MPDSSFTILPGVKNGIGHLARACRYIMIFCAVSSLLEFILLHIGFLVGGLISGVLSQISLSFVFCILGLLIAWSHVVLLAEQGWMITRYLSICLALFAILCPICDIWLYLTTTPLLINQALLAPALCVAWLICLICNLGFMAAATWKLQIGVLAMPLVLLALILTGHPELLLINIALKILTAAIGCRIMKQLSDIAPRIISLPNRPNDAQS